MFSGRRSPGGLTSVFCDFFFLKKPFFATLVFFFGDYVWWERGEGGEFFFCFRVVFFVFH